MGGSPADGQLRTLRRESAAALISKPAAQLLNFAPVNNRGSPFKLDALSSRRATSRFLPDGKSGICPDFELNGVGLHWLDVRNSKQEAACRGRWRAASFLSFDSFDGRSVER